MASDDEVNEETSFDPTFATAGPRRSTFTPPPGVPAAPQASPAVHDDDELANALAADLGRFASGAIPVVDASDEPEAEAEAAAEPAPESTPEPAPAPAPAPDELATDSAPSLVYDLDSAPPPAPETIAPPDSMPSPPPWSSLPAPDPAQAVDLPEGPPQRPIRRSLRSEELLTLGADQDAGTRIEQLEAQLRLRDEEAREFSAWESSMIALGTPDALAAVEQARADFTDVVATPTGTIPVQPTIPPFEAAPFEAAPVEAPMVEPPPVTGSAPVVAAAAYEVMDEDDAVDDAAPPALPAWEVPAPSDAWNPTAWDAPDAAEPEAVPAAVEPESAIEAEAAAEPEIAAEPEEAVVYDLNDDVADEPALESPSPFAPPPLVEPPPFGGPPLLPSQASALPPLVDAVPEFSSAASSPEEIIEAEVVETGPGALPPRAREFSFDDLLAGTPDEEEPPVDRGSDAVPPTISGVEGLFIEPMPVAAGESVPTETGSVAIVEPAYEEELDDDVDETDRVQVILGATGAPTIIPPPISPPSGPISTIRVPEDQTVLLDNEPVSPPAFRVEAAGTEPTPLDQRVGRAARLFWLWFAANSSVLSLGLGATVFAVGMSLRQSIVAVLAGVALSFIPLGLTTLAGKRSGQPTMVISRATFGHLGNVLPAIIALLGRVFWGAVLLWLIASSIAVVLVGAELNGPLGEGALLLISLAVAFVVAALIAFTGYALIARFQLILSIVSGVLVVGFIALTVEYVDIAEALTVADGSWLRAVTGAVLVFSFIGLVWANSGADLARYPRPGASGGGSMLWATFGATLPSFLLIAYGALLASSNAGIASGFLVSPLDTLAMMLPLWYPVPLLAATTLSLLSGVVISVYSGGFALQSIGVRVRRQWSVLIVAALLAAFSAVIALGFSGGVTDLFRDAATTLAVPTAAWAGIFAAETMIRNRRFESQSLVERGGIYADWRWGNVIGFVVISAIGFGLTTASVSWLGWQGYLFTALGVPLDSDLAGTDGGVLVALLLGILLPIVIGIPGIRKQEESRAP